MRVLFWVQHLLGTGHLKRAATVARALVERGLEVTLVSGGPPAPWLVPDGVELVQLPPVRARDLAFSALVDEADRPLDDDLRAARRAQLLALLAALEPRIVITEMFPFGRRAFRFELLPLLEAAAAMRPRPWLVCSVRDILVSRPVRERYRWMRDLALARYDRVLVHTDPALIPFELTFPYARDLGARLVSTGYVVEAGPPARAGEEVLISAGGGRVGGALVAAALAARPLSRHGARPWRVIAGGAVDGASLAARQSRLAPGIVLERQRDDFQSLLVKSLLSVSQAGYNTVVEVLRLGKPMVLVPFETASETEQRTRAERLSRLGLAEIVWESELTPSSLARAIDRVASSPPEGRLALDLEGAATSARLLAELAARAAPAEPGG
ncbi:MAG TPA: glycosyltransferase [Geminicoccaceae bacterium]|nr:glycosyltransferase [Geminicoccaceae bacterium]